MSTTEQRRDSIQALRSRGLSVPHDIGSHVDRDTPGSTIRRWAWWSAVGPRPTANGWRFSESELVAAQRDWDASKQHADNQTALAAELDARALREAEQHRIETEERDAATREKLLIAPKRAYLAAGGTEAGWDEIKDDVAADIAKAAAVSAASPPPSSMTLPKSMYQ